MGFFDWQYAYFWVIFKFHAICNPIYQKPVFLMKIAHNLDPQSVSNWLIIMPVTQNVIIGSETNFYDENTCHNMGIV